MARIIERKPIPIGSEAFEIRRQKIIQDVLSKIPEDLVLPDQYIDNPPLNVTGVPRECGLLTKEELDITENYTLIELVEAIASRHLTSVQVTKAFAKRACVAHQLTFCLTEIYMEEAIAQARKLDDHLQKTGKVVGPLHGVPISVKEMIPVKDQLCSLGLIATRQISKEDCYLIKILRDAGAVFYVKTHQPTACFLFDSLSALGRTLNPHNIDLIPGGSSGGEGALLAMKGSILGLGTDLGGSIRCPAAFSGVYGLKGSKGFWPAEGMLNVPFAPALQVNGIVGPMGRYLADLDYMNHIVQNAQPWLGDPDCLALPYAGLQGRDAKKRLKIGILKEYDFVQPPPPVAKAMQWVQEQLTSAKFQTMPFKFLDPERAHNLYCSSIHSDGFLGVDKAIEAIGEPTPPILNRLLDHMFSVDSANPRGKEQSASIIATKKFQIDAFRSEFLASWVEQGDPDIVIAPMSPAAAHDTLLFGTNVSQTHLWNLLDYPGIVVPTPFKMGKKEEYEKEEYEDVESRGEWDREVKELWKAHEYVRAPICLQILAKKRMESVLMEGVGRIAEALQLPRIA